jgi:hypothetical protein
LIKEYVSCRFVCLCSWGFGRWKHLLLKLFFSQKFVHADATHKALPASALATEFSLKFLFSSSWMRVCSLHIMDCKINIRYVRKIIWRNYCNRNEIATHVDNFFLMLSILDRSHKVKWHVLDTIHMRCWRIVPTIMWISPKAKENILLISSCATIDNWV